MDKKSKFRKVLATTSALAVIVGGASSAMGFDWQSNGGVLAKIADGQAVVGGVSVPGGQVNWTAGDNFNINAANNLDLGIIAGNHPVTVGTITVTQGGRTINVLEHSSAISVLNGGNTALLVIADNMNFTLNGTVMTGLGNITIGAGGGGTESLIINAGTEAAPVVLAGTIDGNGANEGTITVNANKAVTFNGKIGNGQPIKAFTLGANSIVNLNANASVGNNGIVLAGANAAAAQLNVANGVTITGKVSGNGANEGIMRFAGAGIVTGQIGNGGALKEIIANGGGIVDLQGNGAAVLTQTLTIANAGADVRISANGLTGATVFNANGLVKVAANGVVTGAVTTTSGDATGANGGKIEFAAAGQITGGRIGADANRLAEVKVAAAGILQLDGGGSHYVKQFSLHHAGAQIKLADNGVLVGNIVATNADGEGKIIFLANGGITGQIGAVGGNGVLLVEANGAGTVNIGAGNHKITSLDLKNGGSIFTFADGANVTGTIRNTQGGANGVVNFTGNGEITGTTGGAGVLALATVNLNGDADTVVKFGDKITAANINTVNGGTLELNGVAGNDIVGSLNFTANGGGLVISGDEAHNVGVITTVGNVGTVEIKNTVGVGAPRLIKFEGQIGNRANANSLELFTLDSGANLVTAKFMTATANSQITAIHVGTGGGILEFAEANATHKIGGITVAPGNKGTLKITNSTTFESAANNAAVTFGTAQDRLAEVEIGNGQTLTVGDGISIFATKLFGTAANGGVLTFLGDSTFSATSNGNIISDINVNGAAGKVVKLLDVTNINGIATVGAGTLEISSNFTAANLKAAVANNGTVRFTNGAAMTVAGTVGNGGSLNAIEFAGSNVEFTGVVTHAAGKSFTFTDAINAAAQVTFNAGTDVGGNDFVNSTTKGLTHTVVLNKNLTDFAGVQLAADPTKHINFQLDLAKDVTLSGATVANGANFTTGTDTKGDLIFNTTNAGAVNSVGAAGKTLADVQFTKSMTVTNGLFATNVNVGGAQIATVGGRILGNTFVLDADASKVILSNGVTVDTVITAKVLNKGLVEFAGNATLNKDIGTVANAPASVTFADTQNVVQTLNTDNIFATNILLRQGAVNLNKNISLTGSTTASNTSIALNDKKLTVAAGNLLAFSGNNNITLDVAVNGTVVTGGGQIVSLGTLEFAAGTTIKVAPNGGVAGLVGGATIKTSVITSATVVAAGKTLDLSKVDVKTPDTFTKWTAAPGANGGLDLIVSDRSEAALLEILGSSADAADKANIAAITSAAFGTDGNKVREMLRGLNTGGVPDKAKVNEALDRLPALTTVSDAVESTASAVSMGMSQRMTNLAGSQGARVQNRTVASNGSASGIAAGDGGDRYGIWASPFFGKTTQKENKGAAGYKSNAYGASFGFDTRANEDMIVGAAFTVANTEMKHRNFKSGDKTKISSMMFSIYGMQQITDNWFAHGVATFGSNEVKNAEKRVANLTTYDTVHGKYNSASFNGEAMFGYNVLTDQVTFTPMAGLRYSRVNDGGYKETGSTTGQNLDVNTKASNKLEMVAGVRVAGGTFASNGMTLTPEIHGFVNHDLIGKNPKQTLGLAGTNGLAVKSNKPVKTTFNLGLGVNAEYGMMEYGAGYDAEIATKRLGHQGTLKIRVNF